MATHEELLQQMRDTHDASDATRLRDLLATTCA